VLEEIRWGLSRPQKQLSSKFFYDTRGSELFEAITELPEYYPTRTETSLLKTQVAGWVTEMAPASLVELGAGSARKTRILLAAMARGTSERTYAPVDVAGDFLRATAEQLRVEDPSLEVRPQVMDITKALEFVDDGGRPVSPWRGSSAGCG
jgi:L-histidine N-alpha-methyltransferase